MFLSQLIGILGKIGSEINQISTALNEDVTSVAEKYIVNAHEDLTFLRDIILKALKSLDK